MSIMGGTTRAAMIRRAAAALVAVTTAIAAPLVVGSTADAAIVPTVPLGTAANYSVLAGTTVTNTGPSVLRESLGVWSGSSITGFPPGLVVPPATTDQTNAAAQTAQADLTTAYVNAAGRPLNASTTADLSDLSLPGGVYAAPSKGPLTLNGNLVLDGAGDPSSVFIFQTDSTFTTASGSTVSLINGAQECNVFWLVGSSATLGTGSVLAGNILALTSITVTTGATVRGRALARNGAVTLDTADFAVPTCATAVPPTTTTTAAPTTTTTTTAPVTTTTVTTAPATTSPPPPTSAPTGVTTAPDAPDQNPPGATTTTSGGTTGGRTTTIRRPALPSTGSSTGIELSVAAALLASGGLALGLARTRRSRVDRGTRSRLRPRTGR
jgi:LPXTG-motif cell wall-anchored protein